MQLNLLCGGKYTPLPALHKAIVIEVIVLGLDRRAILFMANNSRYGNHNKRVTGGPTNNSALFGLEGKVRSV
jgi:hypothetical protein